MTQPILQKYYPPLQVGDRLGQVPCKDHTKARKSRRRKFRLLSCGSPALQITLASMSTLAASKCPEKVLELRFCRQNQQ